MKPSLGSEKETIILIMIQFNLQVITQVLTTKDSETD